MKLTKPFKGLIRIHCENQETLAKTFIRFQEYYESPEFRFKPFTLGEYREWYIKQKGSFSYYSDWNGFNIPSYVIDTFRSGLFDPLTEEEKKLLEILPPTNNKYYIIGTHSDNDALDHEICHAKYYSDDRYNKDINEILLNYNDKLINLKQYLLDLGYHKDVINDEMQAYLIMNNSYLDSENVKYPKSIIPELKEIYIQSGGKL